MKKLALAKETLQPGLNAPGDVGINAEEATGWICQPTTGFPTLLCTSVTCERTMPPGCQA